MAKRKRTPAIEHGVIDGLCDELIFPETREAQMTLERNGMPRKLARRHTAVLAAQMIKSLERSWSPVAEYLSESARPQGRTKESTRQK